MIPATLLPAFLQHAQAAAPSPTQDVADSAAASIAHALPPTSEIAHAVAAGPGFAALIPFLPLLGCILCTACAALKIKSKVPAFLSVGLLALSFLLTFATYRAVTGGGGESEGAHAAAPLISHAFDWISFNWGSEPGQAVIADFSFYLDSLTCLWMLFVTGLATLIALYASEYMAGDLGAGYCRFFAAFNLFVFSMACLVMGDNMLLLFLGWEGVGLCSYLLIGYFYKKPSAVAAAKKAFIMNRIGDLGLVLGVMLTFVHFGTLEYAKLFEQGGLGATYLAAAREGNFGAIPLLVQFIPVLLTIGAFGKSAQLFLYVWLPDAMEGPTPVSALIHAATMVTAGVYLVARFFPIFMCSEWALPLVGWGGAITALWAATIGMAQFDIKRIMAYSTVSQLGYMFAGLGVMGHDGAAGPAHVFTHAFFKALLFLACGAVMHGFAGQLDLRKLSGLSKMPGWKVVSFTMLIGCLNLAGFPIITSGYWSKDMILGDAFANPHTVLIGWVLLLTAGLTAYYTFRVYFRVFVGPAHFEPGDEVHGHDDSHGGAHDHEHNAHKHNHADTHETEASHADHFHPHAPGWAINTVLLILAVASFAAIPLVHSFTGEGHHSWLAGMVHNSTAGIERPSHEHALFFGQDAHKAMMVVSGVVGLIGIALAWYLHLAGRTSAATSRADALLPALGPIPSWAQGKWFVDEFYHFAIVMPLRVISHLCHIIDRLLVDGLVNAFGWSPRGVGEAVQPSQDGLLHSYAFRMIGGMVMILIVVLVVLRV